VRALIDEDVWRQAFLQSCRHNALGHPSSFKVEFKRRSTWSRQWKTLPDCAPGTVGASAPLPLQAAARLCSVRAPQKLRRFALKVIASLPQAHPPKAEVLVVDGSGREPGSFPTISAALRCAKPYDRVLIRSGRYEERLAIDKPVELVGEDPAGSVVLVGVNGPAVEASSRIPCRVAKLTIQQQSRHAAPAMSGAVIAKGGATLVLEECVVSSQTGHCVVVQGLSTNAYVLHNHISRGKGVGVLVCDYGKGVVEDNEISHNGRAGVAILSCADPQVRSNKIHAGLDSGVLVSEKGRGRVEANDIFANRRAGVAILKDGEPLVLSNRIHDGRDSGVLVCENGQGLVKDNEIFANQMAGIAIGRGGASRVTGNTIRDSNGGSLCLSMHSRGVISANVIQLDDRATMQVPEDILPGVRQQNTLLFTAPDGAAAPAAASPTPTPDSEPDPDASCELRQALVNFPPPVEVGLEDILMDEEPDYIEL